MQKLFKVAGFFIMVAVMVLSTRFAIAQDRQGAALAAMQASR